jgi:hypothetical protein
MKLGFTEINGKEIKITDMEFLYNYTNEEGENIAVFEFNGEKIERVIKNN